MEMPYLPFFSFIDAMLGMVAFFLALLIFDKVYSQKHKRPWLYIGIAAIFLSAGHFAVFVSELELIKNPFFNVLFGSFITFFQMAGLIALVFALFFELLIIRYYRGKFVRIKFIPVDEGNAIEGAELALEAGEGYLAHFNDREMVFKDFTRATHSGYQGFLLSEVSPYEIRREYGIEKTPIAWITFLADQTEHSVDKGLTQNSDIVEPLQLNNIVSFVETFLDEATTPFIILQADKVLQVNNFSIVAELISYLKTKVQQKQGIFVVMIHKELGYQEKGDLLQILKELK